MSSPPTALDSDHADQDRQRCRAVLHELMDMAMDLARAAHKDAKDSPTGEAVAAFDRLARIVRRTVLLAQRLDEAPRRPTRTEARQQVIRRVEDRIGASCDDDRPRAERLRAEFAERLDAPDLDADFRRRPIPEIIEEICRDLGLEHHKEFGLPPIHQRRTPADVARLLARARSRGMAGPNSVGAQGGPPAKPPGVVRTVPFVARCGAGRDLIPAFYPKLE